VQREADGCVVMSSRPLLNVCYAAHRVPASWIRLPGWPASSLTVMPTQGINQSEGPPGVLGCCSPLSYRRIWRKWTRQRAANSAGEMRGPAVGDE
jgi:hypothetical protein